MDSANRRIAKNTIFLYIRTIIVLLVTLYTSRLVFQALGVTDMGIFNVVGGIVTLMTFLQAALTNATSRFITYELGLKSDEDSQKRIFAICITIHLLLAVVAIFVTETIGLWAVNRWTDIPSERMYAANVLYQFVIITFLIQLIRVPYDAVIVAHEKMSVYAYMSIIEAGFQFLIALFLIHYAGDRLVLYGGMRIIGYFLVFYIYYLYVKRRFAYYQFRWKWDKEASKKVLSFSGWTLLGSGTNTVTQQGVSLLMNNFVGLVANAALGFAQQVNGAVGRFVTSFSTAFNPQVIKLYASGNIEAMHVLVRRASKFSFVLCYAFALPLIINMQFVLNVWLGEVPEYTVAFCQLMLICSVIDSTTGVFNTAITAEGNIKGFQIWISISFLLDLLCSYLLLVLHFYPAIVFGSRIITRGLINMGGELFFMKKQLSFDIILYAKEVLLPIVLTIIISSSLVFFVARYIDNEWTKLIVSTSESCLILGVCLFAFIMNKNERHTCLSYIQRKIHVRK